MRKGDDLSHVAPASFICSAPEAASLDDEVTGPHGEGAGVGVRAPRLGTDDERVRVVERVEQGRDPPVADRKGVRVEGDDVARSDPVEPEVEAEPMTGVAPQEHRVDVALGAEPGDAAVAGGVVDDQDGNVFGGKSTDRRVGDLDEPVPVEVDNDDRDARFPTPEPGSEPPAVPGCRVRHPGNNSPKRPSAWHATIVARSEEHT